MEALGTLQYELTPLNHRTKRVHQLSAYIMCATAEEVREQAEWSGKESRTQLMERLQQFLPASVMLPPRRLLVFYTQITIISSSFYIDTFIIISDTLIKQSIDWQTEKCPHHNASVSWNENLSLVVDHMCSNESFPSVLRETMTDHTDEVWFCSFSPDGTKLATGSKDQTLIIWDVPEVNIRILFLIISTSRCVKCNLHKLISRRDLN